MPGIESLLTGDRIVNFQSLKFSNLDPLSLKYWHNVSHNEQRQHSAKVKMQEDSYMNIFHAAGNICGEF